MCLHTCVHACACKICVSPPPGGTGKDGQGTIILQPKLRYDLAESHATSDFHCIDATLLGTNVLSELSKGLGFAGTMPTNE